MKNGLIKAVFSTALFEVPSTCATGTGFESQTIRFLRSGANFRIESPCITFSFTEMESPCDDPLRHYSF